MTTAGDILFIGNKTCVILAWDYVNHCYADEDDKLICNIQAYRTADTNTLQTTNYSILIKEINKNMKCYFFISPVC